MKYNYNVELEAFKRADNRGKPLYVNITEANRIISLINLGYSVADITNKISLSNPKGTVTTINSFIKNYKLGNIVLPDDAPAPVNVFDSLTDSDRLDSIEERISKLENDLEEFKKLHFPEKSVKNKVKSWLKY